MEWVAFWSAVVGGLLVIAGQVVLHVRDRFAKKTDKQEADKDRIAALALEVLNWLQADQQAVFQARGGPVASIQQGHPVYALAANLKRSQPALAVVAGDVLREFREYYQVTRILIPMADPNTRVEYADRVENSANRLLEYLGAVVSAVCPPSADQ